MKIHKNKSLNKKLIVALIIGTLLVVSVAIAVYAYMSRQTAPPSNTQSTVNYSAPSEEEVTTGEDIKKNSETAPGSDPSPEPSPTTPGGKATVPMSITATSQDVSAVHVRALIETITASGSCTLTMQGPNSKTYTATAGVQPSSSTTTCKGFDIPISSLSVGQWSVLIVFENDTLKSSAAANFEVK